jgi:phospholipid/cholesterol/gamma-HCH transport system substrate-binding protein
MASRETPSARGVPVPSRKEIRWSQLKVGALVLVGVAILIGIIFLMSGSTGGLFSKKLTLRSYFSNASGLKNGAPVTLEGVTIGNVTHIRIVPSRNPNPVEVTMQVGERALPWLHTDSNTAIRSAGVLGDSFLDISSEGASGPTLHDNDELKARNVPSIQQVVDTSQETLQQASMMMRKVNAVLDTLNSKRGTAGEIINDPELYKHMTKLAENLDTVAQRLADGQGTLGKMMTDDSLYAKLSATVDRLDKISESLAAGEGTAGKLLHDETLYNNLNKAVENTNKLVDGINQGKGTLGELTQDQELAKKLDDTATNLDTILKGLNEGKGTLGQMVVNRSMYDHIDQTAEEAHKLIQSVRENPKKYLVIHMRIF